MKKQLLFFNLLLRKGIIAFALLFFTFAVNTAAMASGYIDPPGRVTSKIKALPGFVTTSAATNIGAVSASLGGITDNDGFLDFQDRGIVWALTTNPTINNNKIQIGSGDGSFNTVITNLPSGTLIHFRAYGIDSYDPSNPLYGADLTFTTGLGLSASQSAQTNIACNGGSNGAATVSASGGITPYTYSWSPSGGTGATASGLTAGAYTCTVTDKENTTKEVIFNLSQPSAITATPSTTSVSCFGGTNGTATVNGSGGTPGYTYLWSNGATTKTATGLLAGTYNCTITDANACTHTINNIIVGGPASILNATPSTTSVSCFGGSNGTATVVASGGTPGYTYSWLPTGGTAATATGLTAGTYSCTITDANSCTRTINNIIVGGPTSVINATPSTTPVSCFGGSNGTATVAASGGTPGYTYSWSPSGGTAATASGLTAGTYSCTITDANSCTRTINNIIVGGPSSSINTSTGGQSNVSCNGGSNGVATVIPSGGTGPYTYSWAPSGGTAATASGLTPGAYTVTITDANGCTATRNYTITQPSPINTTSGSQTNVSCNGGANGSATVTPSGGTGPYTYSWAPTGGTAATATGLTAGSYTVTVTDANGCTATRTFTITAPSSSINTTSGSQTNVSCNGGSNGSATITPSGGTGPYTYSWAPSGGTAATASGLTPGAYTVTITDANGCTATRNYTITQPSPINTTSGSQTNVSCNGGANGSATVTPSGGTGTYTYSWSPSGGTAATASGLTMGTYTVTITDANGCTAATRAFTITQPSAINTTIGSQVNVSCNGGSNGSATITPSGGAGFYSYSWSPSGGTAATASGLTAGAYTVTVTDANGCTATRSFTITESSSPINTASGSQTNVSCNGGANGTATVSPSGGAGSYTYSWSPTGGTAATASGLTAGAYTVTVTDANGCTATRNYTITQPSAINTTGTQTNLACNGGATGSASVTATGGTGAYTYSWSPSGGTASTAPGLTAGAYTVTITDANGCTATRNYTITQPSPINTTSGSQTNVSCNGGSNGSATVAATGGAGVYTYSWSPSGGTAATATGLTAGAYTVTITDANGCTATRNYTITQPSVINPSGTQVNVTTLLGTNGSATVTVTGGTPGYAYSWSPSGGTGATASGLAAGSYTCYITDANGCTASKTFNITQPVVLTGFSNITKNYGDPTFSLTAPNSVSTGAFSYSSSDISIASVSGTAVTILKPGTVTITTTQAATGNYSTSTTTATLTIAKKDISLTLNQVPAISKTYDGTTNITLVPANYSLIGVATGDILSVSSTTTYQAPNAGSGKTITASNFVLSGTLKDYYNLTTTTANVTGSITPKTLTATAATVTKVYDGTDLANVSFNPLTGVISGDIATLVQGTAVYDNKNVGSAKPISTTGLTLNGSSATNYTLAPLSLTGTITPKPLTITADNKDKFMGTANPTLTASYTGFATGESNSVLTTQPVLTTSANLNSPIGAYDINIAGAAAANYNIEYAKGTLTIKPGAPKSIALAGVILFEYSSIGTNSGTLTSTSDDPQALFTYSLVPGAGDTDNSSFSIVGNNIQTAKSLSTIAKTNYSILVRSTSQHGLSLEKAFTINLSAVAAKATNIMSPNGDGVNDQWVIDDLQLYPNNEVKIFDRTGRAIYSKKGYDNSWEGTLNGAPLAEGTYFYIIDFGPGKPKTKGYITITRSK